MKDNLKITKTIDLDEKTKNQLLNLWNTEYPEKLSYKDLAEFDDYLQKLTNLKHLLLTSEENIIYGWAFSFDRENEKWFAIILSEIVQGQGLGREMLNKIKQSEYVLNGWVIDHYNDKKKNGQTYTSPLRFYEKCDFEILKKERLELDNISAVKIKWTARN
jgi:GNAT superfamily N-acetyltransferase